MSFIKIGSSPSIGTRVAPAGTEKQVDYIPPAIICCVALRCVHGAVLRLRVLFAVSLTVFTSNRGWVRFRGGKVCLFASTAVL